MDRFITIEMDVLNDEEEHGLLQYMFPHVDSELLKSGPEISHSTRIESKFLFLVESQMEFLQEHL